MLFNIDQKLQNVRNTRAEKRALNQVPARQVTTALVRSAELLDLREAFSSKALGDEWKRIARQIEATCAIDDGQTGAVNPGDRRAIWYLVRHLGVSRVLEIGTHVGASTAHIATALRQTHENHPTRRPLLVSVDFRDANDPVTGYWKEHGLALSPQERLERLGCGGWSRFVTRRSADYLAELEETFDLIFLDGDHLAPAVYEEIVLALPRLTPGGLILLHDYFPHLRPLWTDGRIAPGPFLAMDRLAREGAPLRALPLGDLPWQTKQGSQRTSLALVVRSNM